MGRLADGTLVPRTLPGETVAPRPDGTWRILQPSPDRVAAPCPHFGSCGACAVQHLRDEGVAAWKAGIVREALSAQGLAAEIADVLTSPPRSRRRARLAGRRLRKGGATLGFHARASEAIVDNPGCLVLDPALMTLRPALLDLVALAAPRGRAVALTVTASPAGADVLVEEARPLDAALRAEAAAWAASAGVARLTWGAEPVAQAAPPWQPMGRARVVPPPGAFLQPTREGEAALVAAVRAATAGARRILDLFAGCGTFALPLAEAAEVHAAEGDRAMVAALLAGWRGAGGLRRLSAEARDLFRRPLEGPELARFDAAVLDPPRAGAAAQVAALAAARVPVLAYVSCHPASFARDARQLAGAGYAMDPILVVDQFRWSPHVELVTRFRLP
ncbi:class I SAM-dependent RNA methyltransferase [Rubellimicrobium sp. CFH 75288]|uniref:class I SAM-dependent RNA methyltransferase n=1 Tax=Rubellimicrobium sp. CFH 75288 TaxID=2697034 RepID=UPI00141264EC|nr:class I SAM-dependent RNA methyltransferase [Rubellimicrobium sp. CFH 75288]NAZ37752.1 class I SAM-dependent RNA methyltransferase [Rubellimicrobium sp. CFH 75288]